MIQVGTDLRLWLRQKIDGSIKVWSASQLALLLQAKAHTDTLIPGYTHLQRAQPSARATT